MIKNQFGIQCYPFIAGKNQRIDIELTETFTNPDSKVGGCGNNST
jgi:hypothetical protein